MQRAVWCLWPALLVGCALTPHGPASEASGLRYPLRNPLEETRQEVIELIVPPGLRNQPLTAIDERTGETLALQYPAASDRIDRALVQVRLDPHAQRIVRLRAASAPAPVPTLAYGRHVPERKDDFAWENDRIAFRVYGPALAADGEVSSGVDVWAKRVRTPVIDRWYAGGDYHADHGQGLDFYKVGPSRGCGGIALRDGDGFVASGNYLRWRRLAAGPLRVVFELDYASWGPVGAQVVETKRISLDAGSNFSRIETRLTPQSAPTMLPVAIGVQRAAADRVAYDADGHWASVWSAPLAGSGSIGCAVVLPAQTAATIADRDGHLWLSTAQAAAEPLIYYAGAAWSQGLDFRDADAWNAEVEAFARRLTAPIQIGDER
ncbi:DUF4861 family protein [Lysobacter sp. CA199]|uniref:DUF4861 family protein n=1 Tax=Lysobacter sp. CA199 TaxID=3455608 RepID=UPI003F8D71F8